MINIIKREHQLFSRGIPLFCANDVPDNPVGSRHPVSPMRFTSSNWVSILDFNIDMFLLVDRGKITWNETVVNIDRIKRLGSY